MGKKENETQKVSIHTDGEEEMNTNMSRREEMFHRQTPWGATWETEGGWERREVFGRSNGGVTLPQTVNNSQFCLMLEKILPLQSSDFFTRLKSFWPRRRATEFGDIVRQTSTDDSWTSWGGNSDPFWSSEAFCLLSVFSPRRPWDQFVTLLFWQSLVSVRLMSRYEYNLFFLNCAASNLFLFCPLVALDSLNTNGKCQRCWCRRKQRNKQKPVMGRERERERSLLIRSERTSQDGENDSNLTERLFSKTNRRINKWNDETFDDVFLINHHLTHTVDGVCSGLIVCVCRERD